MLMARGKRPGNARCRKVTTCPLLFADWTTSVLLATPVASAGSWCVPALSFRRPTVTTGSAVLGTKATGGTERNCVGGSLPSRGISLRTSSPRRVLWCGWTANTAWEPWSRISLASPVGPEGVSCRVVVATHPAEQNGKKKKKKKAVGVTRAGVVYELFFTNLSPQAFTASDVVELYLHRGAFEPVLADEDTEQDPDRWCSHATWGQEAWQVVSQWVWNIRLELGHHLEPTPLRITEFAPAIPQQSKQVAAHSTLSAPVSGYGQPTTATSWKTGRFTGADFPLQPDGTLRCPAGQKLLAHERRREADGSVRVVYAASIRSCRPCPLREQCQWQGGTTKKPRQVSVLLHPLVVGNEPLLWYDWNRRHHRRVCMQLLRQQRLDIQQEQGLSTSSDATPASLSSAHITASTGLFGSLAMHEFPRLVGSRSSCSVSQKR